MGNIATSWAQTHPSYIEPGLLIQYNQASGAFEALAGGNPQTRLGAEDLYVYMKRVSVRTKVMLGQQASNQLPSASVVFDTASTATYLQRVRAEYDHHDTARVSMWGSNIVEAQRLAMRQGHFQLLRNNLLYGVIASNGEGLLNANGATAVNLPADPGGNTTVSTYDNGAMAFFLLQQVANTKARTMMGGIPRKFVILAPQRILLAWQYQDIVQLTSYQRPGAGSEATIGVVANVMKEKGDDLILAYDDTLIGKGAGGTDAVLLVMPEVEVPKGKVFNTNDFALLQPGIAATTLMYTDVVAPIEIPTPLAGGAVDVVSEMRASPGWAVRPEALTILSMGF